MWSLRPCYLLHEGSVTQTGLYQYSMNYNIKSIYSSDIMNWVTGSTDGPLSDLNYTERAQSGSLLWVQFRMSDKL